MDRSTLTLLRDVGEEGALAGKIVSKLSFCRAALRFRLSMPGLADLVGEAASFGIAMEGRAGLGNLVLLGEAAPLSPVLAVTAGIMLLPLV